MHIVATKSSISDATNLKLFQDAIHEERLREKERGRQKETNQLL